MSDLHALLHSTFGHTNFRANQEAVCHAATSGKDVLLVMPTGAGKSLCYQLPALARGGTALVISPLIALMDDQAAKLSSHGLKVARIHSGLSRDDTRQACRDYLDGTLNFLFIAPERMRVPGFPQMLARRKPSLIAIDEAHCISAWGHDFRPDYRTLGEHLPALRPSPIIALTATATPTVQQDIVAQLHLNQPALFIHGFRRDNLAIEVVEMSKPRRHEFVATLLKDPTSRPAIVYAPSRKAAEELAAELNTSIKSGSTKKIAAAYHAGLEPSTRERVQSAFQAGSLEVVVATIAFGMGIDKADVRTVIHTALPSSVEAFYQEIGRAGRDGLPSRTVLLHSYADRKMHEFFLERDYPPATDLARVAAVLTDEDLMPEPLARQLRMDLDTFNKSVIKLIGQNAATVDMAGNVRRLGDVTQAGAWRTGYESQIAFRRAQLDRMAAFADTQQCRMTALIRHFGDTADAHRPCGHCDFCSPHTTSAQTFAPPTTEQSRHLRSILRTLDARSTSTGKLHTDLALRDPSGRALDRRTFDILLDALARAGLLTLTTETFTSKEDDREITYKKAALTHEGRQDEAHDLTGVLLATTDDTDSASTQSRPRKRKSSASSVSRSNYASASGSTSAYASVSASRYPEASASGLSTTYDEGASAPGVSPRSAQSKTRQKPPQSDLTPDQKNLDTTLRTWRKSEAAKTGKPAFIVLSDAVLRNIAIANPHTLSQLLTISGIGPNKADTYGADIVALCRNSSTQLAATPNVGISLSQPKTSPRLTKLESVHETFRIEAENLKPISMKTRAGRRRSAAYDQSAYRRIDRELDLRNFAESQSNRLKQPATDLLSEAAIAELHRLQPGTLVEIKRLENLRGDLDEEFYKMLLSVCLDEYRSEPKTVKEPQRRNAVDNLYVREPGIQRTHDNQPDPAESLTPDQLQLDERLRTWRKSESERLGLPQFFLLSSSTVRAIVLLRPTTTAQLQTIPGIGPDKIEKFGPAILALCNSCL